VVHGRPSFVLCAEIYTDSSMLMCSFDAKEPGAKKW
jgi:hypothetical protein